MARRNTEERRQRLLSLLRDNISTVDELADALLVSPSTVRRDLTEMQSQGQVARTYGGALVTNFKEQPFVLSKRLNQNAKSAIATRALDFVGDCETLFIDAGTTCLALASILSSTRQRTVVTRGLDTAMMLVNNPAINVVMLGGTVRKLSHGLVGPLSTHANARLAYDAVFLGADVIDSERGLGEPTIDETAIKEAVTESARGVFILADSTKVIGPLADAWLPFKSDWTLVIDDQLPPEDIEAFNTRLHVETVPFRP